MITDAAERLLQGLSRLTAAQVAELAQEYDTRQVAQADDIVEPKALEGTLTSLVPQWNGLVVRTEQTPVTAAEGVGWGVRVGRVDPGHPKTDKEIASRSKQMFDRTGLTDLHNQMTKSLLPFAEAVTKRRLRYQRTFFLVYRAGDFLAVHTDESVGDRVHVQMPFQANCVSGLRTYHADGDRIYRDDSGSIRVLGTRLWHEVLPVLPIRKNSPCLRIVWTFRFV